MKPARRFRSLFVAVVCLVSFTGLPAQETQKLTLETMNDPSLRQAMATPRTWWLDDNTAIIYDTRKPPAEQQLKRLDPATGDVEFLLANFNADGLASEVFRGAERGAAAHEGVEDGLVVK